MKVKEQLWQETEGALDVLPADYQQYLDGVRDERNTEGAKRDTGKPKGSEGPNQQVWKLQVSKLRRYFGGAKAAPF
jgi:hypothetical protein